MTTFISLASSATMFPAVPFGGTIITSQLTPEMIQRRLAHPGLVVSALNTSHSSTIEAIRRRYGMELPLPSLAPEQRAPQVKLAPGDELFIVQATLPRLNEGETHSDETVQKAPISFLRWRVPVAVDIHPPTGVTKHAFSQIIDHAHAIALWQRGEDHLQDIATLKAKYDHEIEEMHVAASKHTDLFLDGSQEGLIAHLDNYLEAADMLYYSLCHWHQIIKEHPELCKYEEPVHGASLYWDARSRFEHEAVVCLDSVIDIMLFKYARRAAGYPKDQGEERRVIAPMFRRTADLYAPTV